MSNDIDPNDNSYPGEHDSHYGVGPHECFWRAGRKLGQSAWTGHASDFIPDAEDVAHRDPPEAGRPDSGGIPCGVYHCDCEACAPKLAQEWAAWRERMRSHGAAAERIAAWDAEVRP